MKSDYFLHGLFDLKRDAHLLIACLNLLSLGFLSILVKRIGSGEEFVGVELAHGGFLGKNAT